MADSEYGSPEGKFGDSPPEERDTFESLHKKPFNIVANKTLINPVPGPMDSIGKSKFFTATPSMVHFGGLVVGKVHEQVVHIVNISTNAQRMYVYPPADPAFKAEYVKQGSLAPGMEQKITIRFRPTEYKYYHDYLRIQTDGGFFILIPLHAYPVLNKLEFPRELGFGAVRLCEPRTRTLKLVCSIPVDFSYELEVVQPHAYYHISPLQGVIPANGSVDIVVKFLPISLGQCSLQMLLHVGQYGWEPMICTVSAQAVSGLIEDKELKQAERRLMDYIKTAGNLVNERLGQKSTFRGDLNFQQNSTITLKPGKLGTSTVNAAATTSPIHGMTKLLQQGEGHKRHGKDPTATLLASTYGTNDLDGALDKALGGTEIFGTKVLKKGVTKDMGVRAKDGLLLSTLQPVPRGPGAGNAFDAGTHWMTIESGKQRAATAAKAARSTAAGTATSMDDADAMAATKGDSRATKLARSDRTVEGLRIPSDLSSFPAVNFVLTQEPGKLKPKDLKIAIEKSRHEREQRAEEQEKIRAEGGAAGQLDLRGILAEERLNLAEGDPFKRQLRELAFLADVDDMAKQDAEKEFRVSEEFLGSSLLSDEDVFLVSVQRARAEHHKMVSAWRSDQSRQFTQLFPMTHAHVKAGAPAVVAKRVLQAITPSFDPNRNDIWGKRMNTLRKFITLVSRHIFRERLVTRMARVQARWHAHGANTREEIRAYIDSENEAAKIAGPQAINNEKSKNNNNNNDGDEDSFNDNASSPSAGMPGAPKIDFPSVAYMVCAAPNDVVDRRAQLESIVGNAANRYEFTANMIRRTLFPKYVSDEGGTRQAMPSAGTGPIPTFDDRTFFQLKVRPEYISMGYSLQAIPKVPVTFPPARDKIVRVGAAEEQFMRPAADANLSYAEMKTLVLESSLFPIPLHIQSQITMVDTSEEEGGDSSFNELTLQAPAWMGATPSWKSSECDAFTVSPAMAQIYVAPPRRCESDDDWLLRPLAERLVYDEDTSLRSRWVREGGFLAANTYLLGGKSTRNIDLPPPPGPTLVDAYKNSIDRHYSGLTSFARDHLRALDDDDADVTGMQYKQAKADELTDSESDDEDAYIKDELTRVPSLALAKAIVRSPEDIVAANEAAQKLLESNIDISFDGVSGDVVLDPERPNEQVELLRDRKILELEDVLRKSRFETMTLLAKRLEECSNATVDKAVSCAFQLPFHMYEESLLHSNILEGNKDIPAPQLSFHQEHQYRGTMNLNTMGSPGMLSPMKGDGH